MSLSYDPEAIDGVPKNQLSRLKKKIEWLWRNRAGIVHKRLKHDLNVFYTIRTGDLRIINTFDPDADDMRIRLVGMRNDVYERAASLTE